MGRDLSADVIGARRLELRHRLVEGVPRQRYRANAAHTGVPRS